MIRADGMDSISGVSTHDMSRTVRSLTIGRTKKKTNTLASVTVGMKRIGVMASPRTEAPHRIAIESDPPIVTNMTSVPSTKIRNHVPIEIRALTPSAFSHRAVIAPRLTVLWRRRGRRARPGGRSGDPQWR